MKHTEHQHQCAVFEWAALMETKFPEIRFMHAAENGGFALTKAQAARRKRQGCKAGVPDIFLPLVIPKQCAGLFIELKDPERIKEKGGGLSGPQVEYRVHLSAEGYEHCVCYGAEEAIAAITDYLGRYRIARRLNVPRVTNRSGKEDGRMGV